MKFLVFVVLVALFSFHPDGCEASLRPARDAEPQIDKEAIIAGLKTVGKVIQMGRDFVASTTFKDIVKTEVVPYHSELAASYGKLNAESVKIMDDELKVMIAAVDRTLTKLHKENRQGQEVPWERYVAAMVQNPLIEKDFRGEVFNDSFKEFSRFGLAKGGIDKQIVNEVESWFMNLIDDADVLASSKIRILDYANIVGCSDAAVEDFKTLIMRTQLVERSILEVGVLRYPDLDNPFFKMFRIKLKAFRRTIRVTFVQKDESGIRGEYNMQKFFPRKEVIEQLSKKILNKAVSEVEDLFSF